MFRNFWNLIKSLFGIKKIATSIKQQEDNQTYADEYLNVGNISFTTIFSNKLATQAMADSTIQIPEDNKRAELLNVCVNDVWDKMKKIVTSALAVGGCLIVPYVNNGKILYNIIKQNRLIINSRDGEKITNATVLADCMTINNTNYYRLTNYSVVNNTLYITNKTISEFGAIAIVDEWKDIKDIAISNVDRVLFGFIKSPIDNRKDTDVYGVPITYGCKEIEDDIKTCMQQIRDEFELKQVRLQADDRTFKKDPKTGKPIIENKLFMAGWSEKGNLFNIFDPAIRESSYYARLNNLFELFEKQVGTSRGILTKLESYGATATEIKNAVGDTFAMITDIRKAIEKGLKDYIYACNILANYYSLTPDGKYNINFDWSYSMIESTTETWQQMKDGQSIGTRKKAELRAWQTGESLEEAQKVIDEIAEKEPNIQTLIGMSE